MTKNTQKVPEDQLHYLPIESIVPNRFQPRKFFDQKELEDLAESIDANGLLQPIIVRKLEEPLETGEEYELIAGERRWRAHKHLDKKRIKVLITEHDDKQSATLALIENLQRADLSSMEEAFALRHLMELTSATQEGIAKQIGKSRSYVSNVLRLVQLPDEVQASISKKELDLWHGLAILTAPKEHQVELSKKAVEKGWTITELRKHVDKLTGKDVEKEKAEKEKEEKEEIKEAVKNPLSDRYILLKLADDDSLNDVLESLAESGFVFFQDSEIKAELKRAGSAKREKEVEPVTE